MVAGLSRLAVFCFFGRNVSRRVGAWQPWCGNSVGVEERFSGEFKGRRKPIKRFISCLYPNKHYYSFCCFLINGKPVKKFFLCTTTTTTKLHTLSTYSTSVSLRSLPTTSSSLLVYRQKCHSASFIVPPIHATLFARPFSSLLCSNTLKIATDFTGILLCL